LRFAITGNPVGAPVGEIIDIIGYNDVIKRLENAIDYLKDFKIDDESLETPIE
jgi:hypothetical protein